MRTAARLRALGREVHFPGRTAMNKILEWSVRLEARALHESNNRPWVSIIVKEDEEAEGRYFAAHPEHRGCNIIRVLLSRRNGRWRPLRDEQVELAAIAKSGGRCGAHAQDRPDRLWPRRDGRRSRRAVLREPAAGSGLQADHPRQHRRPSACNSAPQYRRSGLRARSVETDALRSPTKKPLGIRRKLHGPYQIVDTVDAISPYARLHGCNDLPSSHSITSSARARSVGGIVRASRRRVPGHRPGARQPEIGLIRSM